jgi:transcriptional regulator with XRE-family HTH domain
MADLSDLRTADEIIQEDMADPAYRREYERTQLASEVAIKVIKYRVTHGLSQADLARLLGWKQPNVARLESGDHEPTLSTLARLALALKLDFSVTVKPDKVGLRYSARGTSAADPERKRA